MKSYQGACLLAFYNICILSQLLFYAFHGIILSKEVKA